MDLDGKVRPKAWGGGEGPAAPREVAHVTTLGALDRVFVGKEGTFLGPMVISIFGGVFVAVGVVVAVMATPGVAVAPFGLGLFFVALGLYNVLRLQRAARMVVTFADGFAAVIGANVGVWKWSDVATIVSDERMITGRRSAYPERSYVLTHTNGETLVLLDQRLDALSALVSKVKERAGAYLVGPMQTAYDAGETLTFGAVRVSKAGIHVDGRQLSWASIDNVAVKDGRLIVTPKDGSPLKVRVKAIPNVEVLGTLIGIRPSTMDLLYY